MVRSLVRQAVALGAVALASACGGADSPSSIETPTTSTSTSVSTTSVPDDAQVVPIFSEGPVAIQFLDSVPRPGTTIAGCGGHVEGCRERLSMTFRLLSGQSGTAIRMNVYLHADNQIACLSAQTGAIAIRAGVPLDVQVVLNQTDLTDRCRTPLTMATMDAVLSGTVEVGSRQSWQIVYRFEP